MYGFLYRLGTWLLTKVGMVVAIVVVALVGTGLWLYVQDQVDAETRRMEYVTRLKAERSVLESVRAEIAASVAEYEAAAQLQRDRIERANRIIATLRQLENWWDRIWGNPEQQQANADQIVRMEALRTDAGNRLDEIGREIENVAGELQSVDFRMENLSRDIAAAEEGGSVSGHYLRAAWLQARDYLLVALALYLFGPTVVKVLAYYVFAPWLGRGRPIRFEDSLAAMPAVRPSQVSIPVDLWPGEVLRVKENFLQTSDQDLRRKTRFVFDWAIPFTSVACGLIELVELRNRQAGGQAAVTLSNGEDPHTELAVIEVPDGASIVLRPSFLVGVITRDEDKVAIRRRWTLLRWQAWVTLQFRYFEFVGPCRLVVAGSRGVREERMEEREGASRPARRTNQLATIGFTPNLDYLPVRAETFWGYYRGMNPLFDDMFAGSGMFVLQETASDAEGRGPRRFWAGVWNGVLKVFGI